MPKPASDGSDAISPISKRRAAARRIVENGKLARELITRIRSQFKKDTLQREIVDANEIIREMIALLRGQAMRYNISVRRELALDLPDIMGDRVQLQQVTMNLLVNSIDAMKDVDGKREIAIKSQRTENDQLLVSVSDNGIGLPPQQAEQIFNAFLPPSLTAPVWAFASAGQSLNPMADACGLPTTPRAAQRFGSACPPCHRNEHGGWQSRILG